MSIISFNILILFTCKTGKIIRNIRTYLDFTDIIQYFEQFDPAISAQLASCLSVCTVCLPSHVGTEIPAAIRTKPI